jgi:hypothetical protein
VKYVPGRKSPALIAVGPQGADYSNDDGKTWTAVAGLGFHTFSFSSTGRLGWGAGGNGRIARLSIQ